jgi:RNA polymerase sigma-70 factor (ECF subfamily)
MWNRERRGRLHAVPIEEIEHLAARDDIEGEFAERDAPGRLRAVLQRLEPPDRQIMALYLDGLDATSIAEVSRLSAGAVATRVHRLKTALARLFKEPGQ